MRKRVPECCRKKLQGGERYTYFGRNFVYDVDLANQLVKDGRRPLEMARASVRKSVKSSRICDEHILHTDVARPGIVAHAKCVAEDGEVVRGQVLIDGNHRAAHCLLLKRPFFAYVLSEAESEQILLRKPVKKRFPKRDLGKQAVRRSKRAKRASRA